ncbi:MAG: hypothetical protein B6A08_00615 [Sorangiineae bacterium NIC37A_2]|jgi:tetratricopeptide (TPR) repeat protein|nr:MAG: hypothetical protein B6A08_00615 [Sorangiineae bacterium NIC37A_2]
MMPIRPSLFFATLLLTSASFAETRSASDARAAAENPLIEEARKAFAEGRLHMDEGRYREAVEKFRMAAQVKDTPGLRYYIAYCLEQLTELLEAKREYDRAAELLSEFEANDVRELLPEAQERINRALPSLILVDAQPGDIVQLDGSVAFTDEPLRINPGHHILRVVRGDAPAIERSLSIAPSEQKRISLRDLTPSPVISEKPAVTPAAEPSSAEPNLQPIVFWSSVGLAAAGVGVGLGGFLLRADAADESKALASTIRDETTGASPCGPRGEGHPGCAGLAAAGDRHQLGNTLFIAGAIGAGAGLTGALLSQLLWPRGELEIGTTAAPDLAWFSVRGRF